LNALYSEVENLRADNQNLTTELENKEGGQELIVLPDPEAEKSIKKKEMEIEQLKTEMEKLTKQVENRKKITAEQSDVIKRELAAKNAFDECERAISKFMESVISLKNSYGSVSEKELEDLGVIKENDIEAMKKRLLSRLN